MCLNRFSRILVLVGVFFVASLRLATAGSDPCDHIREPEAFNLCLASHGPLAHVGKVAPIVDIMRRQRAMTSADAPRAAPATNEKPQARRRGLYLNVP